MGNIELKLNIGRLDLILVGGVVIIATILFFAFVIWLVKSARQNKSLKSIDSRLADTLEANNKDNRHTIKEYIYIDKSGNKTIKKENIQESFESKFEEQGKIENDANVKSVPFVESNDAEIKEVASREKGLSKDSSSTEGESLNKKSLEDFEEDEAVDVMAEIQKMLKNTESYQMPSLKDRDFNVGKSGKAYSREDIENIIKD